MKKTILILIFILVAMTNSFASTLGNPEDLIEGSHHWVVYNYFACKDFPDLKKYISEKERNLILSHPTFGESLSSPENATFTILKEAPHQVVYHVSLNENELHVDLYCFLSEHKGIWRIDAIRSLSNTHTYQKTVNRLSSFSNLSESDAYKFENSQLVLSSDMKLKQYLITNLEFFKKILISLPNQQHTVTVEDNHSSSKNNPEIVHLLKKVYLNSVRKNNDGSAEFVIGGESNSHVGYMYIPEGARVPSLSADKYIYIEEIVPNWYIYKTI